MKLSREELRTNIGQCHFRQRVLNSRNVCPSCEYLLMLGPVRDAKVLRLSPKQYD